MDFASVIRTGRKYGVTHFEVWPLNLPGSGLGYRGREAGPVAELLAREGACVDCVTLEAAFVQEAVRDRALYIDMLKGAVDAACALGAKLVNHYCYFINLSETPDFDTLDRYWAEPLSYAKEKGVTLVLENEAHDATRHPETMAAIVEHFGDPAFRTNFDAVNYFHASEEGFPAAYEILRPYIGYGSKPVLRPDTVWFDPCLEDPEDYETLEMTDPFGMLQKQLEVAENLAARSRGDYLVSMPDNCVAIDALAHLRGSEDLLCDMLTDPDEVLAASAKLIEGWKKTTMAFHEAIGRHQDGNCIGWLTTYAPGLHAQVQCDLGAMISRDLVEKFFLNELREACRFLEYSLYHLDGIEQKRFLDLILSVPELKMIQWTSVDGQPPALASIESLRAVQAAGKGLLLNLPAVYVKDVLEQLSPKGLYIVTTAPDESSAKALVDLAFRAR